MKTKSDHHLRSLIITTCIITMTQNGLSWPIVVFYGKQFGVSASFFGWLVTAYLAIQLIAIPFWGAISDRIGRRPVLLIGLLGSALAMAVMGFARSSDWIFASRLLSGFFGANIALIGACVADCTTVSTRTKSMASIEASATVGQLILGPLLGGILSDVNLSLPFYVASGLSLINFAYAFVTIDETRVLAENIVVATQKKLSLLAQGQLVVKSRNALGGILAIFLMGMAQGPVDVCYTLVLKDLAGFTAKNVAFLLVFLGVMVMCLQIFAVAPVAKKIGEVRLVMFGGILLSIAMIMLGGMNLFLPTSIWVPIVEKVVYAFGIAGIVSALASLVSTGSAPETRGTTMGLFRAANPLGRMAAPLGGYIYQAYGSHIAFFAIATVFATVSGFCLTWKWEKKKLAVTETKTDLRAA